MILPELTGRELRELLVRIVTSPSLLTVDDASTEDVEEAVMTAWEVGYQHGVTAGRAEGVWRDLATTPPPAMNEGVIAWGWHGPDGRPRAMIDCVLYYRRDGSPVWRGFDTVTHYATVADLGEPG